MYVQLLYIINVCKCNMCTLQTCKLCKKIIYRLKFILLILLNNNQYQQIDLHYGMA